MKVLSPQDIQAISGGHTPLCVGPHACITIAGVGVAAAYFGWEYVAYAIVASLVIGGSAYVAYEHLACGAGDCIESH